MKKTLFCTAFAVLAASAAAGATPATKTKVQPRMNYFTERDSVASVIITGSEAPGRAVLEGSDAPLELTRSGRLTYTLPLATLRQGDNTLNVRVGDSTYAVRLTRLPYKDNGVQIDYLTGMLRTGGLPFVPSGFYCYSPVQPTLQEEEAVKGMNLIPLPEHRPAAPQRTARLPRPGRTAGHEGEL